MSPVDLLAVAYRSDGSDEDWLGALADCFGRVLGPFGRLGTTAHVATGRIEGNYRVLERFGPFQFRTEFACEPAAAFGAMKLAPPEIQDAMFFANQFASTASVVTGLGETLPTNPVWMNVWKPEVKDSLGVVGQDGALGVLVLSGPLDHAHTLNSREMRLWRRVANHLGAALRLRRATVRPDAAAAVLAADGRVLHVGEDESDGTTRVVEGFERRRAALASSDRPEGALEVWQGLIDGRWSLLDYLDTDGKALVLAVRNEPARSVPLRMTDGQRAAVALASLGYGNKQIAYALGLSQPAVAMLFRRARTALGARNRAELVQSFKRALQSGGAEP